MPEYAELHCHSYFSLLDGASTPQALAARAAELGMPSLALTDHNAVYGAVSFAEAAKQHGINPIFGAELTLEKGAHLTLLAADQTGWHNLCRLISIARGNAPKGDAALPSEALAEHTEGLIALSGCRHGDVTRALLNSDPQTALVAAQHYRELFGSERYWIELQHHFRPEDKQLVRDLVAIARRVGVGYVATNNVHYAERTSHRLQDVLVGIKHLITLDEGKHLLRPNSEYYLKSAAEMQAVFTAYPEALRNTIHIAEQCDADLNYTLQELPVFPVPQGMNASSYLQDLCEANMRRRYPSQLAHVQQHLQRELDVITRSGLANYFLIVWDIVRFSRENGIFCQGRGSAANSLVAYLLNISPVDPLVHDLVFERFLSAERPTAPDIDIDFQADRREEVIQYVYRRYGTDHAAMACTFITFRARSAVRDVGKVLGMPVDQIDHAARALDTRSPQYIGSSLSSQADHDWSSESGPWQQLLELCRQIDGFPRHLGIHNGGMIITRPPLSTRIPTEPATMPDRVVVQWDKDGLETAGLVKIDILGLRMLSAIAETLEIVERQTGQRPDLDALIFDDPAVFEMISDADTIGVFQVESRAQAQMLPRFRPNCFADLIVAISLIRPGPIQGNMVHPYLRRRLGDEEVSYLHPLLEPALKETLGVILFQEQVLKVARDLAGFTPGQGEQLRRALGSKRSLEEIERLRAAFVAGAVGKGVTEDIAETVFDKLKAFGLYSFPKSHAAAFSVLVYQSGWLKRYHPAAFYTALLNNQPMGFWSPAVIVHDAKHHGVPVLPPDINISNGQCMVEGDGIRMGLEYVKRLGEATVERVLAQRQAGKFRDLHDFCRRTRLPRLLVESLIASGAMDAWRIPRRQLLWKLGRLDYQTETFEFEYPEDGVVLPQLSRTEAVGMEYGMLGLSTGDHPLSFVRDWLGQHHILSSDTLADCQNGVQVRVAGLAVVHQAPPTAKGHHFLTLEDEFGFINVIVRPQVYARLRSILRGHVLLVIEGIVQKKDRVTNFLALDAAPLLK